VEGLRLRCRVHNQYEAECVLGVDFMSRKRREARLGGPQPRDGDSEARADRTEARPDRTEARHDSTEARPDRTEARPDRTEARPDRIAEAQAPPDSPNDI
jgi:hypothetical protein